MCSAGEDKISKNELFSKQFQFAWEHFRFHAEQRTRMFHFFLITAALLLNAFSFLNDKNPYDQYAFLVLCIGGLVSTMFLSLDVRNVQLLQMSEELLQQIEEQWLYPATGPEWYISEEDKKIKLGMLSREAILNSHLQTKFPKDYNSSWSWIYFENIKHKLSVRFIQGTAALMFWIFAIITTPSEFPSVLILEWVGFAICLWWGYYAMTTPKRHRHWEEQAPKPNQAP